MPPPHVIECSRLTLRELTLHDAAFILELLNEAAFLRFIGDKGVRSLEHARDYIARGPIDSYRRHGYGLYLAVLRGAATPIGICGLVKRDSLPDADVGFAFLQRYWARGYAAESAAAVLVHAREVLGLSRILAITSVDNTGSIAVLEKVGLRLEGRVRLVEGGPQLNLFGSAPRPGPAGV